MKEVIYYRCDYCDKDFVDKETCSRHEKAESKKYKNIDELLSLRKRDLMDKSLYYKFFEGDMTDTSFDLCPADILMKDSLSSISQKSLAKFAKKIDDYKLVNKDVTCKLLYIAIVNDSISFTFQGKYYPLEQYEDAFSNASIPQVASLAHRGSSTVVDFHGVKDTELYKRIQAKLVRLIAETKLIHDDAKYYKIDYGTRTACSYNHHPSWAAASLIKTRKFESL